MANSTITLYTREIGIEAEKLQMIEDFENYLSSKATSLAIIQSYQYQKIELTKYLKVDISQSFQSPLKDQNYVYCKIVNSDNTRPIYYWIKKMNWKSSSCIELDLVLDTLNTFKMGVDYTFSPKTIIQRQHKDRLGYLETMAYDNPVQVDYTEREGYEIFSNDRIYVYAWDSYVVFQSYEPLDKQEVTFDITDNRNRYILYLYDKSTHKIIYGSNDPTNPEYFEIHKMVSKTVYDNDYNDYTMISYEGEIVSSNSLIFLALNEDKAISIDRTQTPDLYIAIQLKAYGGTQFPMTFHLDENHEYVEDNPDTNFSLNIVSYLTIRQVFKRIIDFTNEDLNPNLYHNEETFQNAIINDGNSRNLEWYLVYITDSDTPTTILCWLVPDRDIYIDDSVLGNNQPVIGIDKIDRTLSRLIKIIKLPYIPYKFTISANDRIYIDNDKWTYDGVTKQHIQLKDLNLEFLNNLDTNNFSLNNELLLTNNDLNSLVSTRDDTYESKLFHSEFYLKKYVYDSFAIPFKYECIDVDYWFETNKLAFPQIKDSITFKMSNTINSRFGFKFNHMMTGAYGERDFNPYLLIARNNEPPLYNSAYLNYIRTGFNYDVKNKNSSNAKNWIMFGASLSGTIASLVGAVATQGASTPLVIASVSGTIASASSLANAIITTGQNERSIDQKLTQLEAQATNVSNADDLDLMVWYSSNKLHIATYKPVYRVEKLCKDLFYYYGYKDNVTGIPNTNTRIWFNYLKCEPILEFTSINMPQEIEEELKGIMRNGFTIIHKYNNTWDIEQVKENWEVSMLPYLS